MLNPFVDLTPFQTDHMRVQGAYTFDISPVSTPNRGYRPRISCRHGGTVNT